MDGRRQIDAEQCTGSFVSISATVFSNQENPGGAELPPPPAGRMSIMTSLQRIQDIQDPD